MCASYSCFCRQGYGVFLFLWQFFIPLIIFVLAYWKILGVVRCRTKVIQRRQRNADQNNEPAVAETRMIEQANVLTIEDNGRRDEASMTSGSTGHLAVGGQNRSKIRKLSHAQVNVVRTMVYITVCFILCWMPMYLYYLLSTFQVRRMRFFYSFQAASNA